jgi:hypothetical protein
MAYHIKARFADLCGIEKNKLAVYIKRGKVICSGDLIDDSLAINQEFIEKWQVKTGLREQEITVKEPIEQLKIKPKAPNVQKPLAPLPRKIPNVQEPEFHFSGNQLDKQIKEVDLERKMEELEIAKLKRQKMAGESMPTDLVKNTISVYSRSVSRSFNNAADNLLVEFTVLAELTREQVSEMRTKLNSIVNTAVKNACDNAMDMVDNIVDEYKEVRGRGEKIG